jgi:hypothetical protein
MLYKGKVNNCLHLCILGYLSMSSTLKGIIETLMLLTLWYFDRNAITAIKIITIIAKKNK